MITLFSLAETSEFTHFEVEGVMWKKRKYVWSLVDPVPGLCLAYCRSKPFIAVYFQSIIWTLNRLKPLPSLVSPATVPYSFKHFPCCTTFASHPASYFHCSSSSTLSGFSTFPQGLLSFYSLYFSFFWFPFLNFISPPSLLSLISICLSCLLSNSVFLKQALPLKHRVKIKLYWKPNGTTLAVDILLHSHT